MTLLSIEYKINSIQKHLDKDTLSKLEKKFYTSIYLLKNIDDKNHLLNLRKTKSLLFSDILYSLLKHIIWLEDKTFKKECYTFISKNYKISIKSSINLCSLCIKGLKESPMCLHTDFKTGKRNFLYSFFLKVMTHNPNSNLSAELEMGLGSQLMNGIKEAFEQMRLSSSPSKNQELNYHFYEIIKDFSKKSKKSPWFCDLKILEETLARKDKELSVSFSEEDYEKILKLITKAGEYFCTASSWQKWYLHHFANKTSHIPGASQKLLFVLKQENLIYESSRSCKRSKEKYWQLTEQGFKLSSKYFAHLTKVKPLISNMYLSSLTSSWQMELIRSLDCKYDSMLFEMIKSQSPIFPQSILEITKKICKTNYKEELHLQLSKQLEKAQTIHLKSNILNALVLVRPNTHKLINLSEHSRKESSF